MADQSIHRKARHATGPFQLDSVYTQFELSLSDFQDEIRNRIHVLVNQKLELNEIRGWSCDSRAYRAIYHTATKFGARDCRKLHFNLDLTTQAESFGLARVRCFIRDKLRELSYCDLRSSYNHT